MTQPRNATTERGGKRFYTWRKERYWSVTTILGGGIPKEWLAPWTAKMIAEGVIRDWDILVAMRAKCETPAVCSGGDFCDHCDKTMRHLKGLPYAKRDKAAALGTYIHDATEAYVLGKPFPKWPILVAPRMEAFQRFLAEYKPEYELTEASVYNRTQRYAGTLDAIVKMGGSRLIGDTKSGKDIYPEIALQLAAYRHAEFIGLPDFSEAPMPKVDGAFGLHLGPDGTYDVIEVEAGKAEFDRFLFAREIYRWQVDASKHVLVGPMKLPSSEGQAALGQLLADAKGATA